MSKTHNHLVKPTERATKLSKTPNQPIISTKYETKSAEDAQIANNCANRIFRNLPQSFATLQFPIFKEPPIKRLLN